MRLQCLSVRVARIARTRWLWWRPARSPAYTRAEVFGARSSASRAGDAEDALVGARLAGVALAVGSLHGFFFFRTTPSGGFGATTSARHDERAPRRARGEDAAVAHGRVVRWGDENRKTAHEFHRRHDAMGASSARCFHQVRDAPVLQLLDALKREGWARKRADGGRSQVLGSAPGSGSPIVVHHDPRARSGSPIVVHHDPRARSASPIVVRHDLPPRSAPPTMVHHDRRSRSAPRAARPLSSYGRLITHGRTGAFGKIR